MLLCNCFTAFSSHKLHHLWLSSFPVTLSKAATISASAPRTPINSSGVPVAREVCQQITNDNREGEAAKEIVSVSWRLIYPVAKWPDGNLVTGSEGTAAGPSFSCCRPWPGRFLRTPRHRISRARRLLTGHTSPIHTLRLPPVWHDRPPRGINAAGTVSFSLGGLVKNESTKIQQWVQFNLQDERYSCWSTDWGMNNPNKLLWPSLRPFWGARSSRFSRWDNWIDCP